MTDPRDDDPLDDGLFLVEIADPDETDGLRRTFSFTRSAPVLVSFAANRFTRGASRLYQRDYGIGAADWRLLVMLTRVPDSTVSSAAAAMGLDKAAVSRGLARLEAAGLAVAEARGRDERRRSFRLTADGKRLHDEILGVALARQKRILAGFSAAELEAFTGYLRRFIANHDAMEAEDEARRAAPPPPGPPRSLAPSPAPGPAHGPAPTARPRRPRLPAAPSPETDMDLTIWHNPRCSKSRETLALLEARGLAPVQRRYLEDAPTPAELLDAAARIGIPLRDLARRKEKAWKEMGLEEADDATLAAAMHAEPKLIERPVVFLGDRAALGRPPEAALEALGL